MTKWRDLNYGQAAPEAFFDAIMELLGTYSSGNFVVTQVNATTLRVPASAGNGQVAASIGGAWRYNVANADAVAPAGGAATYTLWITASANSFVTGPPEVDNTVYAFGLEIRASGSPAAALSRQIGTVDWTGTAIRGVTLTIATPGDALQAGFLVANAGSVLPANWLNCDGAAVSRTTYARLFAAIGTVWGVGDGSTTFNVPDYRSKLLMGAGAGPGLTSRALGASGGVETVALAIAEMPVHDHGAATLQTTATGTVNQTTDTTASISSPTVTGAVNGASATGSISAVGDHTHGALGLTAILTGGFITMARAGAGVSASRFSYENTAGAGVITSDYTGGNAAVQGNTAAAGTHAHTFTPTPHAHTFTGDPHTHTVTMNPHAHTMSIAPHSHVINPQGSGTAHTNMPPWAAANVLIKAA